MMKTAKILIAIALAAPMGAMPAFAQGITTSALRGLDSRAPIDVDADRIDVLDQQNQAIFTGNVRVRQGNLTLEADRIKVAYSRPVKGDPVIQRLDADGNVRIVLSLTDPTVPNWLDPVGIGTGSVLLRWYKAKGTATPETRLVALSDLRRHLPADTPTVAPSERAELLKARARASLRRFKQ